MSIGMTYEEFWYKDVNLVKFYRKAHDLKTQRINQEAWLQGMYIYDALCSVSPLFRTSFKKGVIKPEPYTKEPYPITESEIRERKEREARKKEERMKAQFARYVEGMIQRNKSKQMPVEAQKDKTAGDK